MGENCRRNPKSLRKVSIIKQKKALIIGISGQDGAYLAKALLEKGYQVHGTSRDHEINSFQNLQILEIKEKIRFHSLALNDFRSVLTILKDTDPDEIYGLAGQTSVARSFSYPFETFESISSGTLNILECLRIMRHKAKFYNASSSECFGNTERPADESTPFHPRSPYAVAKAAAHHAVVNYREAYNLFACNGILFNHESPLRPERFVTQKIVTCALRMAEGSQEKLEIGNIFIERDWGWAPEYVEAMWKILQEKKPEDFVIGSGKSHSLKIFIEITFELLNLKRNNRLKINKALFRPSDILKSCSNPKRAKKTLKWETKLDLPEIIKKMIQRELN